MTITHLRLKSKAPNKKGDIVEVFDNRALTIATRHYEGVGSPAYACGWSFSHSKKGWNRKKALAIAQGRLRDSPVRLYFDTIDEVETVHIVSTIKGYLLAGVKWETLDAAVLRPSRFNYRVGGQMLGPGGSLVSVFVDTKSGLVTRDPKVLELRGKPWGANDLSLFTHWALRQPGWAQGFMEELP